MANDLEMDGSLHDAASSFAALDDGGLSEPSPASTRSQDAHPADAVRGRNGQFRSPNGLPPMAEVMSIDDQPVRRPEPLKHGEVAADGEAAADPADEASSADEEYFELAPEKEGEAPVRMKASEVWQKAQDYERLKAEVDDVRKQSIPPQEWDQSMLQLVQYGGEMMRELQRQRAMLNPEPPDLELINPSSPRFNSEAYYHQTRVAEMQTARIRQIEQQQAQLQTLQEQRTSALTAANAQREKSKLLTFWPELRDEKEATRTRDDLFKYFGKYGVTYELINSVHNSAFYALVKSALENERGKQAREAAVKVVRTKPKLVKGSARAQSNPKQAQYATAMQRLSQTYSVDDAAAAFRGLE